MKALHLALSYHSAPALGGPDLTVYKLCTALRHQGVDVDVICTNLATKTTVIQPGSFEREVEGVHVRYLSTRKLIPLGKSSFGLYYIPELAPMLKKIVDRYDVVHLHGYRDYDSVVGCWQAQLAGVPYVVHPRGTLPYQGHSLLAKSVFDRTIGRMMMNKAARLIALSNREVESFIELGADRAKVRVVHNGIDACDYDPEASGQAFREQHGIKERFIVLYLGRVHMIKGIDHMIRSVARLQKAGIDAAAVVVGFDEGYGETLVRIARQEGLAHLYLLPTVSGKQKQGVFGAADILVYAAKVEDFGVSAFEGILSGVPTIVAAGTGCAEIVQSFDAGTIVPFGDIGELTLALQNILDRSEEARAHTLAARSRLISALDWSAIAGQVKQLYEEICA